MISVPNKCASQYIFQMAFKLLGLPQDLIESHKPGQPYSYRSAVRFVNHRKEINKLETNQNSSFWHSLWKDQGRKAVERLPIVFESLSRSSSDFALSVRVE